MKRIVNTGKALRRVVDTGPALPKVDPAEVAKALGASSVEKTPKHRAGQIPPSVYATVDKILANPALATDLLGSDIMADLRRRGVFAPVEAPDLFLARLHSWLDGIDEDHPAPQVRSAEIHVRGGPRCPDYVVNLCRDRPDGHGVYVRHSGRGDTLGAAIDAALDAAKRGGK